MTRLPRAWGVLGWLLGVAAVHVVVPLELSRLGGTAGRRSGAAARGAGLVTATAGAGVMAWAFAAHFQAAPQGWELRPRPVPEYLLRGGPYRLCRNPMYAGEAVLWLGWALFYGRPAVWAGSAIVWAAFPGVVRWEERRLLERFGDDYLA